MRVVPLGRAESEGVRCSARADARHGERVGSALCRRRACISPVSPLISPVSPLSVGSVLSRRRGGDDMRACGKAAVTAVTAAGAAAVAAVAAAWVLVAAAG